MKNISIFQFVLICIFSTLFFTPTTNAQLVSEPYEILLKAERIVLPENIHEVDFKNDISNEEVVGAAVYRLIQFYDMPNSELRQKIKDTGIELLDYIPNKAYVSSIPTNLTTQQLEELNIRSIVKINNDWKQSSAVSTRNFDEWAMEKNSVLLTVRYFQNVNKEFVARAFNEIGVHIIKSPDYIHIVQVQTTIADVQKIVDLPFISYVDQITDPGTPDDNLGRALHRNNMIASDAPSGRHYTGEGVSILVRDDGAVGPHIDFHGRLDQGLNVGGTHGDGVAGVASGAGNLNPKFRGAATGAKVFVRDYQADFLDGTLNLHLNEGVLLTNSSYSNGCNDGYTTTTETVDFQIFNNPTLCHIFSAGNSNNLNCGYGAGNQWGNITGGHKQGKNVIATANLYADGSLVESSSRGPAHDGRIKPDIAANGQDQMSTDPGNQYDPFGGTSAAAPCVMGTMAQLYQAFSEINGGDTIPESALIKATLLNTANDLGNVGPDYKFGWGHLNAYRAVKLLEDHRYFDGIADQDEDILHNIDIPAGTKQVRFMLYWMDEAANPMSEPALVNDLNLTVQDPTSNTLLPWVLNPAPNVNTLDSPATTGVDNLNNMEQVLINTPFAGNYVLTVSGAVVPLGAVKYYVLYELIGEDDITVVYPNGGEGFVPNEVERIHWDALGDDGEFTLEYSTDNGAAWNQIAVVNGSARMRNWTVPDFQTGHVQVRVSRGNIVDQSDYNFSIGEVPQNVEVIQACPDYIRITWDAVDGALGYDVFSLGEKFMDSVATTAEIYFDVPITDPFEENWFAVRAIGNNDFAGRRSIAINHSATIFNCDIDYDVALTTIVSPSLTSLISCDTLHEMVTISIQNNSLNVADSMVFHYQLDTGPIIMEAYNLPIEPFNEVEFTFSTPLTIAESGDYSLTTWVEYSLDEAMFNNQMESEFTVLINLDPVGASVEEDFETGIFPPVSWLVFNSDNDITWAETMVTGPFNTNTTVTWMNNYLYDSGFEEDELVSMPIDLTGAELPFLSFDIAYAPYSVALSDSFRVEIYTECGGEYHSTLYGAYGLDLATVSSYQTGTWVPSGSTQWRNESFDLTEFIGETILLKFISVNNYGNGLFLDNINVADQNQPPAASLMSSSPEVCINSNLIYNNTSTGFGNSYEWDFGADASIAATTGEGPFTVSYSSIGMKTITLIATNPFGTSTTTAEIEVMPEPVPSFTYTVNFGEVTFTNTSTNADSYFWQFGDGGTAFIENPIYIYDETNVFTVLLMSSSDLCSGVLYSEDIDILLSGVEDIQGDFNATVVPNPNQGVFNIQISDFTTRDFEINLIDITGRVIETHTVQSTAGNTVLNIDNSALTAGIYFVKIGNEDGVKSLKVVVQ